MGISGQLYNLLENYLSDRFQRVNFSPKDLLDLYLNNTSCMFLPNFEFTSKAFNQPIKPLYYIKIFHFRFMDF